MPVPTLTATTVSYLFASGWAPRADSSWALQVPGAKVDGPGTAGNLLNVAIWSLREQGLVEVEQVRPAEAASVVVLGGRSAARVRSIGGHDELPGLEGALLRRSGDEPEQGARELVLALDLYDKSPWTSVAAHCLEEARAAGIVEVKGRVIKKPVISDQAALEALKPVDAEIAAARARFREREPELDRAVISDCLAAVDWAHQS